MRNIQWEPSQKSQIADWEGMRLHVKRAAPRSRSFIGKINGETVAHGNTEQECMAATAKAARLRNGGLAGV